LPNIAGEYQRHSVGKDIEEFEGWPKLIERHEKIERDEGFDLAQVHGASFLTGGRITEVLTLAPEMFTPKVEVVELPNGRQMTRKVLEVKGMLLEKRYRKLSNYMEKKTAEELPKNITRRLFPSEADEQGIFSRKRFRTEKILTHRRPFDIPLDEVPKEWRLMHDELQKHLKTIQGQPWLFPSHTKNTHMSRSYVWEIFGKYGIYPHYLRGQRASCLITWNGLSMEQMMEWMSWDNLETARHYGKMGKSKLLGVFRRFR
jgi:integrase